MWFLKVFPCHSSAPATSPHSAPWRAVENAHLWQGSLTVPVINCNVTFPSLPSFHLQWRAMKNNSNIPVSCKLYSLKTPAKSSSMDQETVVSPFRTAATNRSLVISFSIFFLNRESLQGTQSMNSSPVHSCHWRWQKMLFIAWAEVLCAVLTQWPAGSIPEMNISVQFPEWNWPLLHTKIQTQGQQQNCYHNMFTAAQFFSMQSTLGAFHWFDSSCPVYPNILILQSSDCYQEDKYFLTVMTRQTLGKQLWVTSNFCKMPVQGRPLLCCQAPHCAPSWFVHRLQVTNKLQGADFFLQRKSTVQKQEIWKRKGNN